MAILSVRVYLQYLFDGAFERARQAGWWVEFDQRRDGHIVVVANHLGHNTQLFDSNQANSVESFQDVLSWFQECNAVLCS